MLIKYTGNVWLHLCFLVKNLGLLILIRSVVMQPPKMSIIARIGTVVIDLEETLQGFVVLVEAESEVPQVSQVQGEVAVAIKWH